MPTGYTAGVADGKITTFLQFALQCARAMGALAMMRDEPSDEPVSDEQIMSVVCRETDALDCTRTHALTSQGWKATTIFKGDEALLRCIRAVLAIAHPPRPVSELSEERIREIAEQYLSQEFGIPAAVKAIRTALRESGDAKDARLSGRVLAMCKKRGWSLHWTARGAYLHLEASELIEAIRGKHGDPLKEAADVLIVLQSITEANGIAWADVLQMAAKIVTDLETKPHYKGEEYNASLSGATHD